ncbi:MAG TPA: hypothetical protein VJH22_01630 [Candidatus Nanoarchaeia archaeon]|nr:hypothetical protein [Candidatus Nanoarchaeia archaeon]
MKILKLALIIILVMILPGCLGDLLGFFCGWLSDSSHCYQSSAVQESDAENCEKVTSPAGYTMSNPPKDKCYLQIAQNTDDFEMCSKMKGGPGSYQPEECIMEISVRTGDPAGCKKLTGMEFESCKSQIADKLTIDGLKSIDDEIEGLKSDVGSDPENKELREKLKALQDKKKDYTDLMPDAERSAYNKGKISEVMDEVEDEDVAAEIRKDFIRFKAKNPEQDIDTYVAKLKEIKEQKEFVKNLDEQANELVDGLKEKVGEYADEQKEELINGVTEKGWGWMKDQSGDKMKYYLDKLEKMKAATDKASEQYKDLEEKYAKIKKVYDEVSGVYKKVDDYNKQVADGKITEGQAKVLKGAVLLGKGLEYATSYVPVFGDTASKISKATFETTIKFATTRAQRNKKLNDCIEDPENCDPNGISAY